MLNIVFIDFSFIQALKIPCCFFGDSPLLDDPADVEASSSELLSILSVIKFALALYIVLSFFLRLPEKPNLEKCLHFLLKFLLVLLVDFLKVM